MSEPSATAVLERVDAVADRFEAAWKLGVPPRIADFLGAEAGGCRTALLVELVQLDLSYRWKAGAPRRLEDYVLDFPELLETNGTLPDVLVLHARRLQERHAGEGGPTFLTPGAGRADEPAGLRCPHCRHRLEDVPSDGRDMTCPGCGSRFRLDSGPAAARAGELPRMLGKFQLVALLGRGAFGAVYKARDAELDRFVAVKVPRAGTFSHAEEEARFLREARSAAQLVHPGIVQVHAIAYEGDMPYIVSDYVEGRTLAQALAGDRPGFREGAELAAQVADALDYAHRRGVVHRDVNPRNILLDAAGQPHLTDFGLARRDEGSILVTHEGQVLGTPAYMAPEQAAGEQARVDGRSDVYALGVVVYELLTGELPFRGTLSRLLHQVIHDEPRPPHQLNDKVPRDLETVCLKAMAKAPARRYATAGELADELRRFLKGEPVRARPVGRAEKLWQLCRRYPAVAGLVAAVALALLAGTGVSTFFALQAQDRAEEAEGHARQARREKQLSEQRLYVSDLRLARQVWEENRVDWLLDLLNRQWPERTGGTDLRGFEWYYWHNLCHAGRHTLTEHTRDVYSVAFSPDGTRLASASVDGTVRVWDPASGQALLTLGGDVERMNTVAFSPDGRRLIASGSDWMARVWDPASGQLLLRFRLTANALRSLAFSPDGRQLATPNAEGAVDLWDVADGRKRLTLRGHTNHVNAVAFSPDGAHLASAGLDRVIHLWDVASARIVRTLEGHKDHVQAVAFSPDGRHLASAGSDATVRVWDPASGRLAHTRGEPIATVSCVAFSPDSRRLASAGHDQVVRLFDVDSGRQVLLLRGHTNRVHGVAFSPDGRFLASAGMEGTVKVWDRDSLDETTGQEAYRLPGHTREVYSVAFSPDGTRLASASGQINEPGGEIKVWDVAGRREQHTLRGHTEAINCVAFSPDGRWLASASDDGTARLWDAASGREVRVFRGHNAMVWVAAFSPDGTRLATASEDQTARLWDVGSGQEVSRIDHVDKLTGLAFSPDGRRLALSGWHRDVKVVDVDTGREVFALVGHDTAVWSVVYSRDGRRLASVGNDGTGRVWDAADGRQLLVLKGHIREVSGVAFSPDGRRLVTSGWDRTVRVWDADGGQQLLTLRTGPRRAFAVAFSPDGGLLAAGCGDGAVRLWDGTRRP